MSETRFMLIWSGLNFSFMLLQVNDTNEFCFLISNERVSGHLNTFRSQTDVVYL